MSTDTDIIIDEKINKVTKEPSRYRVIMLNDDATPMDWVINVLMSIYKHSEATAKELTLKIHAEGSAIVGIYVYEIAEVKIVETTSASRERGFPLQLRMEEE